MFLYNIPISSIMLVGTLNSWVRCLLGGDAYDKDRFFNFYFANHHYFTDCFNARKIKVAPNIS